MPNLERKPIAKIKIKRWAARSNGIKAEKKICLRLHFLHGHSIALSGVLVNHWSGIKKPKLYLTKPYGKRSVVGVISQL